MPTTALFLPEEDSDENSSNFPASSQEPAPLLPPVHIQSEATVVPGAPSPTHSAEIPEPLPSLPSLGVPEAPPHPGVPEAPPPPGIPGIPPPPPPPMFGVPGAPPLFAPFGQFSLPACEYCQFGIVCCKRSVGKKLCVKIVFRDTYLQKYFTECIMCRLINM